MRRNALNRQKRGASARALVGALALLGCGPAATVEPLAAPQRAAEPTRSAETFTYSPQADSQAPPETDICGIPDRGLREVAESALTSYASSGTLPSSDRLTAAIRAKGLPYVWVKAWAATGAHVESLQAELSRWANSSGADGRRRCGLGITRSIHPVKAVALMADVLADVSPVPRLGRVGQWIPLDAQLHVEVPDVALLALGPHGLPHGLPVQLSSDGAVRAQLRLGAPGRWLFQLLPNTSGGPRPAAEIEIFAGDSVPESAEEQPAPGEQTWTCTSDECDGLFMTGMANRARASEKLPPLVRSHTLEELALQHARAMRDQGRLAHDVGAGDPYTRTADVLASPLLVGENVAHADSALEAHRALWRSPAHRRNLLRREYTHIGVGVAHGQHGDVWVCELFSAEESAQNSY